MWDHDTDRYWWIFQHLIILCERVLVFHDVGQFLLTEILCFPYSFSAEICVSHSVAPFFSNDACVLPAQYLEPIASLN